MKKRTEKCLKMVLMCFLLMVCQQAVAQRMIRVSGTVYSTSDPRKKVPFTHAAVTVYSCKTEAEAEDLKKKLDSHATDVSLMMMMDQVTEIDKNAYYEIMVPDNGALVFKAEMSKCVIEKVNGRMKIDTGINDGQHLQEIVVKGLRKEIMPEPKNSKLVGNRFMPYNTFVIPPHQGNRYSRLIIQPYVLDCNSSDTVAFCEPIVMDGKEYRLTQKRLTGYDSSRDPLDKFVAKMPLSTDYTKIEWSDTVLVDNPNGAYSCYADFCIEDYSNITFFKTFQLNTCLNKRPMRFLEYALLYKELDFEKFKERAQVERRNTAYKVALNFEINSDRLTDDPNNQKNLQEIRNRLIAIVNEPGVMLKEFHVTGTASPEGRYLLNLGLAEKRMRYIQKEVISILPQSVAARVYQNPQANVASWNEVADLMEKGGKVTESRDIRTIVEQHEGNMDVQSIKVKALPYYKETVVPYLEELRQVQYMCQYDIYREPTNEEVMEEYRKNGLNKDYTRYEYWKLFQMIKNDREIELLAKKAYQTSLEMNDPWILAGNILAVQYLKRDTVDTKVLEPLIDRSIYLVNYERRNINTNRMELINPVEVVANQLCMYIKAGDFEQASVMAKLLPDTGEFELMKAYAWALGGYFQGGNTEEERARAKRTFATILNSSPRNKVIMYMALETHNGNVMAEEALKDLPQEDALTWYLRATLAARKGDTGFTDATNALSYCFKLDKSYISIAQNDGEFNKEIIETALDMYNF